ncbi:hypothetical protein O181_032674 [Austropuccinia psidii MF-1]|uniref:CCHC-type domain-containing protein n=1 Tax=Austropuccinia psidii MF-1 TaxID=1389203 RepID=A0A9Q3CX94_9BASI|nr:hypothetical protein [Austropuccinia psidii MF-1]
MRQLHPLRPPPNKLINFLKQGNILIRVKDEGEKTFQNVGAEQIAKKAEEALEKIQASVNGEKITIKSGDIQFFTKNKAQASWILENRHTWTHFSDPLFITSQAPFPVLLCPPQCYNCLKIGHITHFCKNKLTCANCGNDHNTKTCNKASSEGLCVRCVKEDLDAEAPIDMNDDKYFHSAFSRLS